MFKADKQSSKTKEVTENEDPSELDMSSGVSSASKESHVNESPNSDAKKSESSESENSESVKAEESKHGKPKQSDPGNPEKSDAKNPGSGKFGESDAKKPKTET